MSRKIIAGPYVRAACKRHLNDLKDGSKRGLTWDLVAANRAIGFFRDVLTVEIEDDEGISSAVPFVLEPHQCFIVGSLFGWKNKSGFRRFRRAYIEMGKGNGKSPLAAGIGHYMLSATGKLRAEVYAAASQKDQAMVMFRDAVSMWERSPHLSERLVGSGQNPVWQLSDLAKGSFFKPISSENKGKSGARPYCALIDEVHEHPDNTVIEMLRAGTKGNRQALIFEITNSGFDRQSVCWAEHQYTVKVVEGDLDNDAWFGFICSLDKDDEPFSDERCWIKANPNLGVSIAPDYIREQVQEARGMPSKESTVRRLHFCEWTEAEQTWVTRERWMTAEADIRLDDYLGRPCYAGLDLSWSTDLTALALVFPDDDGVTLDLFVEFFTPKDTMRERGDKDGVPYADWVKAGFVTGTDGKIVKLASVAARLGEVMEDFDLQNVAYDRYRHKELDTDLADLGLEPPMIEHPQGFRRAGVLTDTDGNPVKDEYGKAVDNPLWMPSSVETFEHGIIEGTLRVAINPCLRWNVASVVIREDPAGTGNRVFDKRKATGRIDGVVAAAMALGLAKRLRTIERAPTSSPWDDDEGFRIGVI